MCPQTHSETDAISVVQRLTPFSRCAHSGVSNHRGARFQTSFIDWVSARAQEDSYAVCGVRYFFNKITWKAFVKG